MKTHMCGKGAWHWEWHITRFTDIWFISRMNKHMIGKMTFLSKGISTGNTTVWFIFCMIWFWFDFCFTALQLLGHFGRGQLT